MNEPLLQQLKTLLATFSEQECMHFDHDFDALKQAYLRLTDAKLLNAIVQHADDKLFKHNYHSIIAQTSGTLFFLQTQNEGTLGLTTKFKCDTFCPELYQALYQQELTMGAAFSHLRRESAPLKGRKVKDGYIIEGQVFWATGYKIFDKLFIGFNDDKMNEIFAIIDFKASDHMTIMPAADPIATRAANTVSASFHDLFIPEHHIICHQKNRFMINVTKKSTKQASALFGFALAALDHIPEHNDHLKQSKIFFRKQLDHLQSAILTCDDQQASANCRLDAYIIAQQIIQTASLAIGGRATLNSHPLTRIYREVMLFNISGINPVILNTHLKRIVP